MHVDRELFHQVLLHQRAVPERSHGSSEHIVGGALQICLEVQIGSCNNGM